VVASTESNYLPDLFLGFNVRLIMVKLALLTVQKSKYHNKDWYTFTKDPRRADGNVEPHPTMLIPNVALLDDK
jgi:hypothetical protein